MKPFARAVAEFIEAQGHKTEAFAPDDASFTHVAFRTRGIGFGAVVTESDPQFLHLTCAMPIPAEVVVDVAELEALLAVQDRVKCVKFAPIREHQLVGSVELLFGDERGYEAIFWRSVEALELGMREALRELVEASAAKLAAEKFIQQVAPGTP